MKKFELIELPKGDDELDDDIILEMAIEIFEYIMLKRGNGKYHGQRTYLKQFGEWRG